MLLPVFELPLAFIGAILALICLSFLQLSDICLPSLLALTIVQTLGRLSFISSPIVQSTRKGHGQGVLHNALVTMTTVCFFLLINSSSSPYFTSARAVLTSCTLALQLIQLSISIGFSSVVELTLLACSYVMGIKYSSSEYSTLTFQNASRNGSIHRIQVNRSLWTTISDILLNIASKTYIFRLESAICLSAHSFPNLTGTDLPTTSTVHGFPGVRRIEPQ